MQLSLALEHRSVDDYVVPPYNFDKPPSYYVLGGLIFQELSRQYLREWGANWQKDAPQRFVYKDRFQSELYPEGNRRVVVLTQVLPANTTIGYDDLAYLTVTKVNGVEVKSLTDLAEAVKRQMDGFVKVETEEDPKQLEVDVAEVASEAEALKQNYGLQSLQRPTFPICCIADFQAAMRQTAPELCRLEIRDTADLEVCATESAILVG